MSPVIDGGGPSGLPAPESGLSATQQILTDVKQQLQDTVGGKWGDDVLLPYLNLAILEILNIKPSAYPSTVDITCAAGAKQDAAAGTIAIIDIVCVLSGSSPSGAIVTMTKDAMDNLLPGWMYETASATPTFAVLDPNEPKAFYVYPPMSGTATKVRAITCVAPTRLDEADDTFPLDDSYRIPVTDYLIYRCLNEETTIPNALAKAASHYQKFLQFFGIKSAVETNAEAKSK